MKLRLLVLLLATGLLQAPLLADEPSQADETPAAGEEAREALPSSDDFRPTEQLRWDQEVDYPTDI